MLTFANHVIQGFLDEEIAALGTRRPLRVLDLGCGSRPYETVLEAHSLSSVGLDVQRGPGIDVVASADHLPFGSGTYDVVLATEVIEHTSDVRVSAGEICRVLRPGGIALLSWPFMHPLHELPRDYSRPTEFQVERAFWDAGGRIERLVRRGSIGALLLATCWGITSGAGSLLLRKLRAPRIAVAWERASAAAFDALGSGYWRLTRHAPRHNPEGPGERLRGRDASALWTLGYCARVRRNS
jgi:SAM-dependent methyltransferase